MAKSSKSSSSASESEEDQEFKYIVRLANTDIDGSYKLVYGLSQIKGVGFRIACMIVDRSGLSRSVKIGTLTDEDIETLAAQIEKISDLTPVWMRNRRKDYETGEDLHLVGSDLSLTQRDDVNLLKKIRCYRGIRHENGQKVRGQRTRANGRSGLSLGVSRRRK